MTMPTMAMLDDIAEQGPLGITDGAWQMLLAAARRGAEADAILATEMKRWVALAAFNCKEAEKQHARAEQAEAALATALRERG